MTLRTSSGTSGRSFSLSFGKRIVSIPKRCAAKSFSFTPPIGSTRPRKVISPVIATFLRTGTRVRAETIATAIVIPADGPSLGIAPSGICTCRSRLRIKSRLIPRRSARALMQVKAACPDSCITSPSLPVSVTAPRPLVNVASICKTSPPTSVQANPVARPTSLSAATPCWRNLIGPSISCTRSAPITSWKSAATASPTNLRAILRQHDPISRSRLRTPASRV